MKIIISHAYIAVQQLSSKGIITFKFNASCKFYFHTAFRQNATGPSSVCEGSDVTLQCVIIFTSASDVVTVQTTIWNRNEFPVIEAVNSSGTFYIPNHNQPNDPDTGLPSNDLVITNVRLDDDNTNYTCTASGSGITSSVILNVIGKFYVFLCVCTMQITVP